jgi:hypothetical protein
VPFCRFLHPAPTKLVEELVCTAVVSTANWMFGHRPDNALMTPDIDRTAASWVIVKVFAAMVRVVERAGPVLASTTNSTVPLPVPVVPDVMVTHDAPLADVQLQALVVVTVTDPLPPVPPKD